MTIRPSMPTRAASRAISMANGVVNSATPAEHRHAAARDVLRRLHDGDLLGRVSEQFSPTVPQTMRPETPSRTSPR